MEAWGEILDWAYWEEILDCAVISIVGPPYIKEYKPFVSFS